MENNQITVKPKIATFNCDVEAQKKGAADLLNLDNLACKIFEGENKLLQCQQEHTVLQAETSNFMESFLEIQRSFTIIFPPESKGILRGIQLVRMDDSKFSFIDAIFNNFMIKPLSYKDGFLVAWCHFHLIFAMTQLENKKDR